VDGARRLRARAENAGCDLEPVVQRDPLVKQEGRGGLVALCRVDAPALQLPADEWWARLFHDASLADRRRARRIRVLRNARLVSVPC
jgi:hypothetical protein